MRKLLILGLLWACPAFGQYTLTQITSPSGCNLDSRGFNYTMPFDNNRNALLWYGGKAGDGDVSIYSGKLWAYDASTHSCSLLKDNLASGTSAGVCPPNSGGGGSDVVRNPGEGHPYGYLSFDTRRKKLYLTEMICSSGQAQQTYAFDSASGTMDSPFNVWEYGAGSSTMYGSGRTDQISVFAPGATAADDKYLLFWSTGPIGASERVTYFSPATGMWTDVSSTIKGNLSGGTNDGATCQNGSTNCPPAYIFGLKGWFNPNDQMTYLYGGCGNLSCTVRYTTLYQVNTNVSPMVVTKLTLTGSAISSDGSPYAWGVLDTSRNRIVLNDAVDSWKAISLSTLAVSTLTVSNSTVSGHSPNFYATDGCQASVGYRCHATATYDPVNDKFVGFVNNAGGSAPTIYEMTLGTRAPMMIQGSGAPSNSLGIDGDLYYRTDSPNQAIYGPKASGAWPSTYSTVMGIGCTTAYHIDKDCDGYGVGPKTSATTPDPNPLFGMDADDNDATVNTTASVLAKYGTVNSFLTHLGYPTNRVLYVDPDNGNDSTGNGTVGNPYKSYGPIAPTLRDASKGGDGLGGTVLFRGAPTNSGVSNGIQNDVHGYYDPTATAPNNVVFMPYPGEDVTFSYSQPPLNQGNVVNGPESNVIFDGFRFIGDCSGSPCNASSNEDSWLGNTMSAIATTNVTFKNNEVGYYRIALEPSSGSKNHVIDGNVFHDISEHAIYPVNSFYNSGTFNCEAAWTWLPAGENPHFDMKIRNNIFAAAGNNGYGTVHLNAIMCGFEFSGNIIHSQDGTPLDLMNGASGSASHPATISNNLFFSNTYAAILISPYGCDNNGSAMVSGQYPQPCYGYQVGASYLPHSVHDVSIVNNTIVTGRYAPIGCGGSARLTCGVSPTNGITIDDRTEGTPAARFIKNLTFANNIIVTYSNGDWLHWEMDRHSYPETDTFSNNLLYNLYSDHNSSKVMHITSNADCTASTLVDGTPIGHPWNAECTGVGTGNVVSGSATSGDKNWTTFQGYLSTYANGSSNQWGDPKFADANLNYATTPGKFNFRLLSTSPAINTGTATGAPTTDITGASRSLTTPTIGAYEGGSGTSVTVVNVNIQPTPASIAIAGTQTYTCVATWSDASSDSCPSASWSSTSPSVATVSAGTATGVAAGTTTITAIYQGVTSNGASLTVLGTPVIYKTRIKGHPICRNCVFK